MRLDKQTVVKTFMNSGRNREMDRFWPITTSHKGLLAAKSSLSTCRTLTSAKKIFKRRLIERQWLIARIEECKRNHREM